MRVECKKCGCRVGVIEPISTIGWATRLAIVAFVMGVAVPSIQFRNYMFLRSLQKGFAMPTLIISYCVAIAIFFLFPRYMTWLLHCWKRCPKCGARRWTLGQFEGFGL